MEWVKIRSWHIVMTWTRVPGRCITWCHKTVNGADGHPEFDPNDKTCEICYRNHTRANA